MGLLQKIFRSDDKPDARTGPASLPAGETSRFEDSDDGDEEAVQREASRRELVKLVLREAMRRHAVPSDWIDCRILPVVTRKKKTGMHVQFIVRQGQRNLLTYMPAFQSSFMAEVEKFEPRAWDWLLSISWEFEGITASNGGELPGAGEWNLAAPAPAPAGVPAAAAAAAADDDVEADLQALYAIRDAVLKGGPLPGGEPDFEPTRPGFEPSGGGPGGR